MWRPAGLALLLLLAAPAPAEPLPAETLFALPRIRAELGVAQNAWNAGDRDRARRAIAEIEAAHPRLPDAPLLRARLAAEAGRLEIARAALEDAVATGAGGLAPVFDRLVFAPLRAADPDGFATLRARAAEVPLAPTPAPAQIFTGADGPPAAPISAANTGWAEGRLLARFAVPNSNTSQPDEGGARPSFLFPEISPPEASDPNTAPLPGARRDAASLIVAASRDDTPATQLRSLWARGLAAGHGGDLYDNRDGGHSTLPKGAFPSLARTTYARAAREAGLDRGLPVGLAFNRPTLGNASLALTGRMARSMPRAALTLGGIHAAAADHARNRLMVYPEHRDHDAETGDRFPANTPYWVISQGSSSSDKPFLDALALTLAAFKPETKAALTETGLIAPTLQMILRRSLAPVRDEADYLSAVAHPTVFSARDLRPGRMIALAQSITPDQIPPAVMLRVEEDLPGTPGIDWLPASLSEQLFDTPQAIARVWRSYAWEREMVLSAAETRDPNGRPLSFDWTVLRSMAGRVTVTPLDETGTRARIRIAWHAPYTLPGPLAAAPMKTHRVDIAVIASNGAHQSAPAFLSIAFPPHERRRWQDVPDGRKRLLSLDRRAGAMGPVAGGLTPDPLLFPTGRWTDRFVYDDTGSGASGEAGGEAGSGALLGWQRVYHRAAEQTRGRDAGAPPPPPAVFALEAGRVLGPRGPVTHRLRRGRLIEIPPP